MSVPAINFYDAHPGNDDLRREVMRGLAATPKVIPPKFFYDRRGSEFHAGEGIQTENSYKYTLDGFGKLAAVAGFRQKTVWTDDRELFSVQLLEVA